MMQIYDMQSTFTFMLALDYIFLALLVEDLHQNHVLLLFFFKLEHNCFTMLCSFLLCNEVNQLHVYVYPLPLGSPSHGPYCIPPLRSLQSTKLNSP